MIRILILTPELRKELKSPLGLLIRGSFEQTSRRFGKLVEESKPVKIIAVGDQMSRNILRSGISLDVAVVDNKVMRKPTTPLEFKTEKVYTVKNPAGTLTDEAQEVIAKAISLKESAKIIVDGEEDLLTLFAVASAPHGSIVVYGQPREGIVAILVNEPAKVKIQDIINRMEHLPTKN